MAGDHADRGAINRLALDHPLNDPLPLRHGADNAPLRHCGALLGVAHRFGHLRLVGRRIGHRGFGDMHCPACEKRTARSSRGQFRQGHLYRHGQALLLRRGPPRRRRIHHRALPCHINKTAHRLSGNCVNHDSGRSGSLFWRANGANGRPVPLWDRKCAIACRRVNPPRRTTRLAPCPEAALAGSVRGAPSRHR